jgi:hypothetical protein
MSRTNIKAILTELTPKDIVCIIMTSHQWLLQDVLDGNSGLNDEQAQGFLQEMASIGKKMQEDLELLSEGIEREQVFKAALTDIVRSLRGAQRDEIAARLNKFYLSHLRADVFEALYSAAGIDTSKIENR